MLSSNIVSLLFGLSSICLVILSLAVVVAFNPVRSTLMLIASFLPTSLVYLLLGAPFVGILQILVYAGAIMMLFTFVIMMVNPKPESGELGESTKTKNRINWPIFVSLCIAGILLVWQVRLRSDVLNLGAKPAQNFGDIASISQLLFNDPMNNPLTVSFELMSFLILIGIIAAVSFSRKEGGQS